MGAKPSATSIVTALTVIAGALLAVAIASPSYAATLTVCASGCNDTTIAAAIAAASAGDTISLLDAVHTEANIAVDRDLRIQGQGAANTAIDGAAGGTVFAISGGVTAVIQGMTIRNGFSFGVGGGISNDGTITISNSTLSGNSAVVGGGIFSLFGTATITNSALSGNSAGIGGGGAFFDRGSATISNSTLSGNGNSATFGGGIYDNAPIAISSSTLSGNSATNGGGIFIDGGGAPTVKNSIVGNSTGGDCDGFGTATALGANLDTDGSCAGFTAVTSAQLNLGPLALNAPGTTETLALIPGSAAINAATDCTDISGNPVTTDQRGVARPDSGEAACDIGAFELVDAPQSKADCKDGNWRIWTDPPFKNQGQCIKFVNHS